MYIRVLQVVLPLWLWSVQTTSYQSFNRTSFPRRTSTHVRSSGHIQNHCFPIKSTLDFLNELEMKVEEWNPETDLYEETLGRTHFEFQFFESNQYQLKLNQLPSQQSSLFHQLTLSIDHVSVLQIEWHDDDQDSKIPWIFEHQDVHFSCPLLCGSTSCIRTTDTTMSSKVLLCLLGTLLLWSCREFEWWHWYFRTYDDPPPLSEDICVSYSTPKSKGLQFQHFQLPSSVSSSLYCESFSGLKKRKSIFAHSMDKVVQPRQIT